MRRERSKPRRIRTFRSRPTSPLRMEFLEQRRLLAAVYWAVDQDGFWDVPTNWRDDAGVSRLPTADDEVFLDRPAGAYVITHRQGQDQIYAIHSSRSTLAMTDGELYIFPYLTNVVSELRGDFSFSGGILEGALTLSGTTHWSGGAMRKSPGGHGGVTLTNNGTMNLTGTAGDASGFINNSGTINDGTGFLPLTLSLENLVGGVYNVQGEVNPPSIFANRGTLRKSSGNGAATIPYFTNLGGTIEVLAGTFSVDGRGYSTDGPVQGREWTGGKFQVASGAFLDLVGANSSSGFDLAGDYNGSGNGAVRYRGDVLKASAAGATFNLASGPFEIQSSLIDVGATGISNLGAMALTGAGQKLLSGALTNSGTIAHIGPGGLAGGTINNLADGLYDLQGDIPLATPVINAGELRKSAGAGSIALRPFRNLGGTVDVRSGTLSIDGRHGDGIAPAWIGGRFDVSAGATLDWVGANAFQHYDIEGAFSGSGGGRIYFTPAIQTIGAGGATFDFAPGLFHWTSEQNSRFDGHLVTNLGEIVLDGAGLKYVTGAFTNAGTIVHRGTADFSVEFGATFTNLPGAVYDFRGDRSLLGTGEFINQGIVRKSVGAGASVLGNAFGNDGGSIEVQTGTISIGQAFSGGSVKVVRNATLLVSAGAALELSAAGITISYEGNISGSGAGAIRFSAGRVLAGPAGATFNFPGSMFQWTGGILDGGAAGLNNTGVITLADENPKQLQGVVNNVGTIAHGGTVNLAFYFGQLNNLPGAVYDFQGDVSLVRNFSDNTLVRNQGTFRKSAGTTASSTGVPFLNLGGTIDVRAASFVMKAAGDAILHTGGTFLVSAGALLDLNGGDRFDTARFKGEYQGTGTGQILLFAGNVTIDPAGASFNFAPGMFQWMGGLIDARQGTFTNRGAITLPEGNLQPVIAGDFQNAGTMSFVDDAQLLLRGELGLGLLTNLPTGLIEFQGDGGLIRLLDGFGPDARIINRGMLRRTGAAGTARIANDVFSNLGTVEVIGGALRVESAALTQVDGATLLGGAWRAMSGGSIDLANAPSLSINRGNVVLDGAGSNFAILDSLTANEGSFQLLGGRDFATVGALANSGEIVVGPASSLVVTGAFAQAATGKLVSQLGGAPEAGLYGQLSSIAPASLAGAFEVVQVNGFGPAAGQSFQVMTFPNESGDFSEYRGLKSGRFSLFGPQLTSTELRLTSLMNTADVAFEEFVPGTFPASASLGQNVTISYRAKNRSELPAAGDWIDSIYFSRDESIDESDVLFARVEHSGGLTPETLYTNSVTAPLPALKDGAYRVLVLVDSRALTGDADRINNLGVSTQGVQITIPALTVGVPLSASIQPGQELYYRVLVPPGDDLTLAIDFAALPSAEVLLRRDALPDGESFDDQAPAGSLHPRLLLSNAQGGEYFIRLRGPDDAPGSIGLTLTATNSQFEITRVFPLRGSNLGASAILELRGAKFTPQTTIRLRQAGSAVREAESLRFVSENRLVGTISLAGLAAGQYQIEARDGAATTTALDAFEVTEKPPGETGAFIWLKTIATVEFKGNVSRSWNNQRIAFGEFNTSDSPLPAPLYLLRASNVQPGQEVQGSLGSDTVPPRMLPGNYRDDDVQIYTYKPKVGGDHVTSTYDLYQIEPSSASMEWDSRKDSLRPATIAPDAWDAVWENLRPRLGDTLSDFWLLLTEDSEKLAAAGHRVQSIDRLFGFELQMANNLPAMPIGAAAVDAAFPAPGLPFVFGRTFGETISARYRPGRLGRGWMDSYDIAIREEATSGLVTLEQAGQTRFFVRQDDGSYTGFPGEFATLTKSGGLFHLREKTGEVTAFRADGAWDYQEDVNGNRLTAGYSGGQLTTLTHSNGSQMALSYAGNRLQQVTDPTGSVATYEFDPTGQHLTRVTTAAGVTEYVYTSDTSGPRAHAITSTRFVDGSHLFFDYDSSGRLARKQGDAGAESVRYGYDASRFSVTDANDQVTTFLYDDSFRVVKVVEPLGRIRSVAYDADGQPIKVDVAGGGASSMEYDDSGNPIQVWNPLGEAQTFGYDATNGGLVNWRDSLGRESQFIRDIQGNLLSTEFVDGSDMQLEYDAQGNVVRSTNRLGQTIQFSYNSHGQKARKELPDGSYVDYTYNAHGNLETLVDAAGTTRLEYLDAQNPNLVTRVIYPNGRSLAYEFANGRRTRMIDQSGFETRYQYDALGRLDILRDGAGQLVTDYDYDPTGRLAREVRGNGTSTTYAYDHAAQLTAIEHRDATGAIQSKFEYEYDRAGRRTSMTTLEGVTTYEYDGAGRLTSVTLPNLRVIAYGYDAAGNRITSQNGFSTTNYTVNELNQYTVVGSTTQLFDAAGNLVSSISPSGSSSYRYDVEGRLVSQITPQGSWAYEYDAMGNRIASTHNGVRTEFLIDPFGLGDVVGEYDGNGNSQARYVHGLGLTSRVDSAGLAAFYQFDAVGNTTQLTGADGDVLNAYSYLPFGESLASSESVANAFEFSGQSGVVRDGSGLDYLRNRWYQPSQGRFTQADPIGLTGGANLYAYVGNNPVSSVDPTGLMDPVSGGALFLGDFYLSSIGVPGAFAATVPGSGVTLSQIEIAELRGLANFRPASPGAGIGTGGAGFRALNANPARNFQTFSQAQVERALARQALNSGLRAAARGGAYVAIAAGLVSIAHSVWALQTFVTTGNDVGCIPGVPSEIQVCNPRVDFLSGKLVQSLEVTQENPAEDPNDIVGPTGVGPEGHLRPEAPLGYVINFENKSEAVGPAAEVFVTLALDDDLDLDTFQFEEAGFGDVVIQVPSGRQSFLTRIDLTATRGVFVDVTMQLDRATRTIQWTFQSIEPETMDLPGDPAVGFLPPNRTAPEGMGFVSYSVRVTPGLSSGTRIEAQASIVFDTNPAILTNIALNTIDDGKPTSRIFPLPTQSPQQNFMLRWEQGDEPGGSGVASVDIYVSIDGGANDLLLDDIVGTSAIVPLEPNHDYAFYSVATDLVGHVEELPLMPDAMVRIVPGDVNNDGVIDLNDLNGVRNNFGLEGDDLLGDTDLDGDVDLGDFNNVRNFFGIGVASPEPEPIVSDHVLPTVADHSFRRAAGARHVALRESLGRIPRDSAPAIVDMLLSQRFVRPALEGRTTRLDWQKHQARLMDAWRQRMTPEAGLPAASTRPAAPQSALGATSLDTDLPLPTSRPRHDAALETDGLAAWHAAVDGVFTPLADTVTSTSWPWRICSRSEAV